MSSTYWAYSKTFGDGGMGYTVITLSLCEPILIKTCGGFVFIFFMMEMYLYFTLIFIPLQDMLGRLMQTNMTF